MTWRQPAKKQKGENFPHNIFNIIYGCDYESQYDENALAILTWSGVVDSRYKPNMKTFVN